MSSPDYPLSTTGHTGLNSGKAYRREKALVALVGLHLTFLPWAFGGVDTGSQFLGCGLGLGALGLALWPDAGSAPPIRPWSRLRRSPVFWAGVMLFAYVCVQAGNPAFDYHQAGTRWWLEPHATRPGLPTGMNVPFAEAGPWRSLLLWVPPWLLVCAIRTGITRRSSVVTLLTIIAANGFGLAAFGLVQRAAGSEAIYGFRRTASASIFASFPYRNHAAAYFNLVAMVAVMLLLRCVWRERHSGWNRGPAILYLFFSLTLVAASVLTFSLGGIFLLAVTLAVLVPLTVSHFKRQPTGRSRAPVIAAGLLALLVSALAGAAGLREMRASLEAKLADGGYTSIHSRQLAARQGLAMFADRPLFGWGAGCFRYGFTQYQQREPELTGMGGVSYRWEHVHNDWLELLVELGVAGVVPIGVMLATWLHGLRRLRLRVYPFLLWPLGGVATLAVHAWGDFPLQNPAVLATGAAVLWLIPLWQETSATDSRH